MSMAGKVKGGKSPTKTEKKVNSASTREEKLSDAKIRLDKIVKGDDQGYHLR